MKGIIGQKIGMTQIYLEDGNAAPVTVVQAGPCPIIQKKTLEEDGYQAFQLAFLPKKPGRVNKPLQGHFSKADKGVYYILREIRTDEIDRFDIGQEITVEIFQPGEVVDVIGTSKGRGFTGVMKRHGFRGSPGAHGTHEYSRHGGSIGAAAFPSHTFKGVKMPGRHGNARVTVQNLKILDVRPDQNVLLIQGAVPGWRNGIVVVQQAKKRPSRSESPVPPHPDA